MAPNLWVQGSREPRKKRSLRVGAHLPAALGAAGSQSQGCCPPGKGAAAVLLGGYDTAEDGCTTYYSSYTNQEISTT